MLLDKISYLMANNNNQIKKHKTILTKTQKHLLAKKQIPEIILTIIITLKKIVTDKKTKKNS